MVLTEDDDVVEQLAAQGPDPTFRHSILPRTSICRAAWLHAECLQELHVRSKSVSEPAQTLLGFGNDYKERPTKDVDLHSCRRVEVL